MGLTCVLFSTRFEDTDPPVELLHLRVPLRGHDAPQEVLVVEAVSPTTLAHVRKAEDVAAVVADARHLLVDVPVAHRAHALVVDEPGGGGRGQEAVQHGCHQRHLARLL